jgi:hypothetical protein
MDYTREDVDRILEASKKATPGRWIVSSEEALIHAPETGNIQYVAMLGDTGNDFGNPWDDTFVTEEVVANAKLIAGVPILAEEVERLRAEIKALKSHANRQPTKHIFSPIDYPTDDMV